MGGEWYVITNNWCRDWQFDIVSNSSLLIASLKVSHPQERKKERMRPSRSRPLVEQPRSSWMGMEIRASEPTCSLLLDYWIFMIRWSHVNRPVAMPCYITARWTWRKSLKLCWLCDYISLLVISPGLEITCIHALINSWRRSKHQSAEFIDQEEVSIDLHEFIN